MDTFRFHVFHDGAHHGVLSIEVAVHIEFCGVFEEAVDKNRLAYSTASSTNLRRYFSLWTTTMSRPQRTKLGRTSKGIADFLGGGKSFFHVEGDAFSCGRSLKYLFGRVILRGNRRPLPLTSKNIAPLRESCPQEVTILNAN